PAVPVDAPAAQQQPPVVQADPTQPAPGLTAVTNAALATAGQQPAGQQQTGDRHAGKQREGHGSEAVNGVRTRRTAAPGKVADEQAPSAQPSPTASNGTPAATAAAQANAPQAHSSADRIQAPQALPLARDQERFDHLVKGLSARLHVASAQG